MIFFFPHHGHATSKGEYPSAVFFVVTPPPSFNPSPAASNRLKERLKAGFVPRYVFVFLARAEWSILFPPFLPFSTRFRCFTFFQNVSSLLP